MFKRRMKILVARRPFYARRPDAMLAPPLRPDAMLAPGGRRSAAPRPLRERNAIAIERSAFALQTRKDALQTRCKRVRKTIFGPRRDAIALIRARTLRGRNAAAMQPQCRRI